MSEYRADAFYTDATDGRGHSEKVHASLPPSVHMQIGAIVASKEYPHYRTMADLVRDSVIHRLHWLNDNDDIPDLKGELERLRSLNEVNHQERLHAEFTSLVDGYRAELGRANLAEKAQIRARIMRDLDGEMPSYARSSLENLL